MVGDHYDFLYPLNGPVAAGSYAIGVDGEAQGAGLEVQASLDVLSDAGAVTPLFSEQLVLSGDGGLDQRLVGELFDAGEPLGPLDAGCGDTLRVRLAVTAGPDAGVFQYFGMTLSVP